MSTSSYGSDIESSLRIGGLMKYSVSVKAPQITGLRRVRFVVRCTSIKLSLKTRDLCYVNMGLIQGYNIEGESKVAQQYCSIAPSV